MTIEQDLVRVVAEMLSHPQFQFPLAAAQRQYRAHYYGLSSAALLEDLYYDTLSSFLAQFHPHLTLERPPRGERGWDYRFQGVKVSHKVGQGPQDIAALWDATRTDVATWTFDFPVAYLCSGYSPARLTLRSKGAEYGAKAASGNPSEVVKRGRALLVVVWGPQAEATIAHVTISPNDQPIAEVIEFEQIWAVVAEQLRRGVAANHIEIVITGAQLRKQDRELLEVGSPLKIAAGHRPGVYVFPPDRLIDVPVRTRSAGLLLGRETVAGLMADAVAQGLFVPFPIWFAAFAGDRPPDRYLRQRAQFDALFSPVR